MNIKLLVLSSFFIALLFHLAFFNAFTFVFPIDAQAPKPKFFFLGPILTQKEVKIVSTKEQVTEIQTIKMGFDPAVDDLNSEVKGDAIHEKNPFAIQAINKPLTPQTEEAHEKIIIKSTFETGPKIIDATVQETGQDHDPELSIQPYRSLRFRTP